MNGRRYLQKPEGFSVHDEYVTQDTVRTHVDKERHAQWHTRSLLLCCRRFSRECAADMAIERLLQMIDTGRSDSDTAVAS